MATTYHTQTNGQVEVSNRKIKNIPEKVMNPSRKYWSSRLDDALWAVQTAYKTRVEMSSYQLVFRKACHLSVKLEHKAMWEIKRVNMNYEAAGKKRLLDITKLEESRQNAYKNAAIYKEKTKRWHDRIILQRQFIAEHYHCTRFGATTDNLVRDGAKLAKVAKEAIDDAEAKPEPEELSEAHAKPK
ncbi:uncharacterized protein LOC108475857 [Gossypium arboreum]|uniref:uncharacterized protein LOC108475857 n=1 Tax=Gossypium arboreum TaxID=29729 RepID=UPI000818F25E|nr:uncharacterized protein LOC108475857 [Gossypium arboreum]